MAAKPFHTDIKTPLERISEDLATERIAIDSYGEMIVYPGSEDSTARRMPEGILAVEEEHASNQDSLLEEFGAR